MFVKDLSPVLDTVRLLNIGVPVPAMLWVEPPKITVPEAAIKRLVFPLNAVALKLFSISILLPPFRLPPKKFTSPVKVCVKLVPKFKVPVPEPFIVKGPPLTFP